MNISEKLWIELLVVIYFLNTSLWALLIEMIPVRDGKSINLQLFANFYENTFFWSKAILSYIQLFEFRES